VREGGREGGRERERERESEAVAQVSNVARKNGAKICDATKQLRRLIINERTGTSRLRHLAL
jgi:hypothetical protein